MLKEPNILQESAAVGRKPGEYLQLVHDELTTVIANVRHMAHECSVIEGRVSSELEKQVLAALLRHAASVQFDLLDRIGAARRRKTMLDRGESSAFWRTRPRTDL